MGKLRGFLEFERQEGPKRPVAERVKDWAEIDLPVPEAQLRDQAARCMDCGIPFCHSACPVHNRIPDFNDAMYKGRLADASAILHRTNNFPEFTGRICPAPCEASCTLNIEKHPVTIKNIEHAIADGAWEAGLIVPQIADRKTDKRVAVIGSGPAGLAAAQELARRGHDVTVFERDDRIGGLVRYGIPDFKLEKYVIDRRLGQMRAEGVTFRTGVHVGKDIKGHELRAEYDAVVLAGGARVPRDLKVPGRELGGVHFAMDFLTQQNRRVAGDVVPDAEAILATGKRVVVIGGGDTGSDCVGTSTRQRAKSILQLELLPQPPVERAATNPWPEWPLILRTSSSHEEGGERQYAISTTSLLGDDRGQLRALAAVHIEKRDGKLVPVPGGELEIPCELVLLAMGFVGSEREGLLDQLGVKIDARGNVVTEWGGRTTVEGIFAAGDMSRGQSLVVWAIAEGRQTALAVDAYLSEPSRRRLAVAG